MTLSNKLEKGKKEKNMEKKGIKVVLADNNVQDRETRTKAIEEAGMQVVFSTGDGKKALDAIYREQPDIVVMDMILPGLDGIGILEEMEQVDRLKRPVIMVVTALKTSQMVSKALQKGVGYYMMKPVSNKVFGKRLTQIAEEMQERGNQSKPSQTPEQEYAAEEYAAAGEQTHSQGEMVHQMGDNVVHFDRKPSYTVPVSKQITGHSRYSGDLEKDVTNVLLEIGIPAHIKGYQYIRQGIIMSFHDRSMLQYITKYLYPAIAKKNKTTSSSVERTIRHAIEVAWRRGNMEVLEEILGHTVCAGKGKPTNSEFLALLTDRFRLEYREKIVS